MKLLMDADCLIKLTKAGLKEEICKRFEVDIPSVVKKEVVDAGKGKGLSDAELVEKNIQNDIIRVTGKGFSAPVKGDQALIEIFRQGRYDLIATDDGKLIRFLKTIGIPYILPGLLIHSLYQTDAINKVTALDWLEKISDFISEDEYSMIKFLLEEKP
jgi:rRNA-processing protein FCF1